MNQQPQAQLLPLINELATIELTLAAAHIRALIKRSDELKKAILAQLPSADSTADITLTGDNVAITFGPVPQFQTISNKKRLKRLLGADTYDELATFSIKAIEQHLNQEQLSHITELRPGTRHFKEARRIETSNDNCKP